MQLEFNRVEIANFKSFAGDHALQLSKRSSGLHFIRGVNERNPRLEGNGVGKSTIWDAVCWCLTGKTPAGLKTTDIRPWRGKGATRVMVRVFCDGKKHEVERTTNPNSLKINGRERDQVALEKLLGFGFEVLTNAIILGQGRPLFFDLEPSRKLQLLSDALDLERWEQRSKEAGNQTKTLTRDKDNLSGEMFQGQSALLNMQQLIKDTEAKAEEWADQIEKELKVARKNLKTWEIDLEAKQQAYDELDLTYDGALTEARALEQKTDGLYDALRKAQQAHDKLAGVKLSVDTELQGIDQTLEEFGDYNICPTCGAERVLKDGKEHHFELIRKRSKAEARRPSKAAFKKALDAISDAQDALTLHKRDLNVFNTDARNARFMMDNQLPPLNALKATIDAGKKLLEENEERSNPHKEIVRSLVKQEKQLAAELGKKKGEAVKIDQDIVRTEFWVKGMKEVRLYMLNDLLQELQLTTNAMLEELGLVGWSIDYVVESETKSGTVRRALSVLITSPESKEPVRWECWSGGEGQRLRIIGALALGEVLLNHAGIEPDLEVLDEPTQYISGEGVRDVIDYLTQRAKVLDRRIFLTDHHIVADGHAFASVLTIVRDKQGSFIE